MKSSFDYRDCCATGNAAAPQKLELDGFTEETQAWAWKAFKAKAKFLAMKNHFTADEQSALEAEAVIALLRDKAIVHKPASGKTVEEFLRGVIVRKLRQAAARIADERSVWTESRRSLDAPIGGDGEACALGDLVADGANLNANRMLIGVPRAVRVRKTIKRLRDAKDYAALSQYRQALARGGETIPYDSEEVDAPSQERALSVAEILHAKAVSECGYAPREEDEMPKSSFRMRSVGFRGMPASPTEVGLKGDVRSIIRTLPADLKAWCRSVWENDEEPVAAYKRLHIGKNAYYKKCLPLLRKAFAELAEARF